MLFYYILLKIPYNIYVVYYNRSIWDYQKLQIPLKLIIK